MAGILPRAASRALRRSWRRQGPGPGRPPRRARSRCSSPSPPPRPTVARRFRRRPASKAALVTIRSSQVRNPLRPSKSPRCDEGLDHALLRGVLGVLVVAEQAAGDPIGPAPVAAEQLLLSRHDPPSRAKKDQRLRRSPSCRADASIMQVTCLGDDARPPDFIRSGPRWEPRGGDAAGPGSARTGGFRANSEFGSIWPAVLSIFPQDRRDLPLTDFPASVAEMPRVRGRDSAPALGAPPRTRTPRRFTIRTSPRRDRVSAERTTGQGPGPIDRPTEGAAKGSGSGLPWTSWHVVYEEFRRVETLHRIFGRDVGRPDRWPRGRHRASAASIVSELTSDQWESTRSSPTGRPNSTKYAYYQLTNTAVDPRQRPDRHQHRAAELGPAAQRLDQPAGDRQRLVRLRPDELAGVPEPPRRRRRRAWRCNSPTAGSPPAACSTSR